MKRQQQIYIAGIAVFIQLLIIIGLFTRAWYPLWAGQEVRVKTVPVDPRSLFRGNYARLKYDFSSVHESAFSGDAPKRGSTVYTLLKPGADGLYEMASVSTTKPPRGVFIRGTVESRYYQTLNINHGIDAYFAPKEKALKMEADLRNGGIAVLKVSPNGRAAIDKTVPNSAK